MSAIGSSGMQFHTLSPVQEELVEADLLGAHRILGLDLHACYKWQDIAERRINLERRINRISAMAAKITIFGVHTSANIAWAQSLQGRATFYARQHARDVKKCIQSVCEVNHLPTPLDLDKKNLSELVNILRDVMKKAEFQINEAAISYEVSSQREATQAIHPFFSIPFGIRRYIESMLSLSDLTALAGISQKAHQDHGIRIARQVHPHLACRTGFPSWGEIRQYGRLLQWRPLLGKLEERVQPSFPHSLAIVLPFCRSLSSLAVGCSVYDENLNDQTCVLIQSHCPKLTSLNLAGWANVDKAGLLAIAECRKLETLNLSLCAQKTAEKGLEAILINCRNLKRLFLNGSFLLNGLHALPSDTQLRVLSMKDCRIPDALLEAVSRCSELRELYLGSDNLREPDVEMGIGFLETEAGLFAMADRLSTLTVLDIKGCVKTVKGATLETLVTKLSQLQRLHITGCTEVTEVEKRAFAAKYPTLELS